MTSHHHHHDRDLDIHHNLHMSPHVHTAPSGAPLLSLLTLRTTLPRTDVLYLQPTPIATLSAAPGFQRLTWGFQLEDPKIAHWLIQWDSVASHTEFTETAQYAPFLGQLHSFSSTSEYRAHISLPHAKVVEWVTVTLAAETDKEEWGKGFGVLKTALEGAEGYSGCEGGWVEEEKLVFVVLIGWESREAHYRWKDALKEEERGAAMKMFRSGIEGVTLWHVEVSDEVKGA